MWDPVEEIKKQYPKMKMSDEQIYRNLLQPDKFRSAFPKYAHMSDQEIRAGVAKASGKKVISGIQADTNKQVKEATDWTGAIYRGGKEAITNLVTAIPESMKTRTPDEQQASQLWRTVGGPMGEPAYRALMGLKHMGQDVHTSAHQMAGAREAAAAQGEGWQGQTLEELKKAPIMGGLFEKMIEQGPPAPGNITKLTPKGLEASTTAIGYTQPGIEGALKTLEPLRGPVGRGLRASADKTSREMTGLIPDRDKGIDKPGIVAEQTRKITTLKKAEDVYRGKADEFGRQIEAKAKEAKQMGVQLNPTETAIVYDKMDKLLKYSPELRKMLGLDQLKSGQWKGYRPQYLDPELAWRIKDDLDKIINWETVNNKRTPVADYAHKLRTEIDLSLDDRIPNWTNLNERYSALREAAESLKKRWQESFTDKIRASFSDVLSHPISTIGPGYGAFEAAKIAGMPHYMQYVAAVGASGLAHWLYDTLPSQTARIMMKDGLADILIGPRKLKGPTNYPPTVPPNRWLGGGPGPTTQGGTVNPQPNPPTPGAPPGGLPQSQGTLPQNVVQQQVNNAIVKSYREAAKKAGLSEADIERRVASATGKTSAHPADIEPAKEIITDPKSGKKYVKMDVDPDAAIQASLTTYERLGPEKMVIEMVQNAYDELNMAKAENPGLKPQMTYLSGNMINPATGKAEPYIQIRDNGRGMTEEQIAKAFTRVYGSGKRDVAGASGGFGVAKSSFQLGGVYFKADTVVQKGDGLYRISFAGTPDDILQGKAELTSKKILWKDLPDARTGTTVTTWLDKEKGDTIWKANIYFQNMAKYSPEGIDYRASTYTSNPDSVVEQEEKNPGQEDYRMPRFPKDPQNFEHHLETKGASIKLALGPIATDEVSRIPVYIMNKGLLQFTHDVPLSERTPNLPRYLIADVQAKVAPLTLDYPWNQARERLHGDVADKVDKFVNKQLAEAIRKQRMAELIKSWNQIQKVQYVGMNNVTKDIHLWDETTQMGPFIGELLGSPYWARYMDTVTDIAKYFDKRFVIEGKTPKVSKFGLFFPANKEGEVTNGINVPNPANAGLEAATRGQMDEGIFLNPFGVAASNAADAAVDNVLDLDVKPEQLTTAESMAARQWITILHEFAHNQVRSHGEELEGRMAKMEALVPLSVKMMYIGKLRDAIAGVNNAGAEARPHPDFDRAVQANETARKAGPGQGGPLSKTGTTERGYPKGPNQQEGSGQPVQGVREGEKGGGAVSPSEWWKQQQKADIETAKQEKRQLGMTKEQEARAEQVKVRATPEDAWATKGGGNAVLYRTKKGPESRFLDADWTAADDKAYKAEVERRFRERTPVQQGDIYSASWQDRVPRSEMRNWSTENLGKQAPETEQEFIAEHAAWYRKMAAKVLKEKDPEMLKFYRERGDFRGRQ